MRRRRHHHHQDKKWTDPDTKKKLTKQLEQWKYIRKQFEQCKQTPRPQSSRQFITMSTKSSSPSTSTLSQYRVSDSRQKYCRDVHDKQSNYHRNIQKRETLPLFSTVSNHSNNIVPHTSRTNRSHTRDNRKNITRDDGRRLPEIQNNSIAKHSNEKTRVASRSDDNTTIQYNTNDIPRVSVKNLMQQRRTVNMLQQKQFHTSPVQTSSSKPNITPPQTIAKTYTTIAKTNPHRYRQNYTFKNDTPNDKTQNKKDTDLNKGIQYNDSNNDKQQNQEIPSRHYSESIHDVDFRSTLQYKNKHDYNVSCESSQDSIDNTSESDHVSQGYEDDDDDDDIVDNGDNDNDDVITDDNVIDSDDDNNDTFDANMDNDKTSTHSNTQTKSESRESITFTSEKKHTVSQNKHVSKNTHKLDLESIKSSSPSKQSNDNTPVVWEKEIKENTTQQQQQPNQENREIKKSLRENINNEIDNKSNPSDTTKVRIQDGDRVLVLDTQSLQHLREPNVTSGHSTFRICSVRDDIVTKSPGKNVRPPKVNCFDALSESESTRFDSTFSEVYFDTLFIFTDYTLLYAFIQLYKNKDHTPTNVVMHSRILMDKPVRITLWYWTILECGVQCGALLLDPKYQNIARIFSRDILSHMNVNSIIVPNTITAINSNRNHCSNNNTTTTPMDIPSIRYRFGNETRSRKQTLHSQKESIDTWVDPYHIGDIIIPRTIWHWHRKETTHEKIEFDSCGDLSIRGKTQFDGVFYPQHTPLLQSMHHYFTQRQHQKQQRQNDDSDVINSNMTSFSYNDIVRQSTCLDGSGGGGDDVDSGVYDITSMMTSPSFNSNISQHDTSTDTRHSESDTITSEDDGDDGGGEKEDHAEYDNKDVSERKQAKRIDSRVCIDWQHATRTVLLSLISDYHHRGILDSEPKPSTPIENFRNVKHNQKATITTSQQSPMHQSLARYLQHTPRILERDTLVSHPLERNGEEIFCFDRAIHHYNGDICGVESQMGGLIYEIRKFKSDMKCLSLSVVSDIYGVEVTTCHTPPVLSKSNVSSSTSDVHPSSTTHQERVFKSRYTASNLALFLDALSRNETFWETISPLDTTSTTINSTTDITDTTININNITHC